jgi:uncharacterized phage protein (TIGR01671 family)
MRDIKFRAWDRKAKAMFPVHMMGFSKITDKLEFISGVDIHDKDSDHSGDVSYGGYINKMTGSPLQRRYELMQYTGLKDRNGKEIYEGDIVQFRDIDVTDLPIRLGFVSFANASHYIECHYSNHYRWIDYETEVIGNIYEHPHLLEGTLNGT